MRGEQTHDTLAVLYLELTGACNLHCIHCGNESTPGANKHLHPGLVERILKEFEETDGKKLILTGGEPFVYPWLEDVLDTAAKNSHTTKISTNGFLLAGKKNDFVFDYDVGFRVSLDGPKETHNNVRGNQLAYDALMAAMRKMTQHEKQIVVRTTVMKENMDSIPQMLKDLDSVTQSGDISLYSVNIWPIRSIGKAATDQKLTPGEYARFLERLGKETKGMRPDFRIIVGPTFGFEPLFVGSPVQSNQIYTCDMLNTSLHIAYTGDIYPCSFVHHSLGKIQDMALTDAFRTPQATEFRKVFLDKVHHDCDGCKAYSTCKAGCIAETYHRLLESAAPEKVKDVYCPVSL